MQSGHTKRPVSRDYYQELVEELERAQRQYDLALEEASETMRGWSDIAAKASYAGSIQALARTLHLAKSRLDAVTPVDDQVGRSVTCGAGAPTVDEIVTEARGNADAFRLELWNGERLVRELPIPEGPLDPRVEAERLRVEGEPGELRLIRGNRESEQERCVAIYLIRRPH